MKEILLVEDTDRDAEIIQAGLKLAGVANPVRRLADGTEAIVYLNHMEAAAAIGPPTAIILLDLQLPGVSGFEILQHLQLRRSLARTLRIVLSHFGDTESLKRAYSLGAHSFLSKPMQQADLLELFAFFPGYWLFTVNPAKNPTGTVIGPAALSRPAVDSSGPRNVSGRSRAYTQSGSTAEQKTGF